MRKTILALFFAFVSFLSLAQSLSDASSISLLTASPGTELYSTFGHSAIRVKDPTQNLDTVFNYGTFDPDIPDFYVKFARRKVDYALSVTSFESFTFSYKYENRSVTEQILNLSTEQKRKLYALLLENSKEENRYYKYDFFFDNCASRIRDIMITAFGDDFKYNYPEGWNDMTFRNLIDLYLINHHWSDFGIDLALGLPTDAIASPSDYMFLPDYLAEGFELATIVHDGETVPFTLTNNMIVTRRDVEPEVYFITPGRLMWTLFLLCGILSFVSFRKGININWFDILYFSVIGIVGWVVFLLWFFTDHIATKDNLNLLWAVPLHFPIFIFWSKISSGIRRWYIWLFGGIDLLLLIFWLVFPQNYHVAFIPMILIMLLRYVFMLISQELKPSSEK